MNNSGYVLILDLARHFLIKRLLLAILQIPYRLKGLKYDNCAKNRWSFASPVHRSYVH